MSEKKIIIAIDGYSSCGKSTFAKAIAAELNYIFIDTGAMYRAVTLHVIRHGILEDQGAIIAELPKVDISFRVNKVLGRSEIYLGEENVDQEIRSVIVNENVSLVSQIPEVRAKLVAIQKAMGEDRGIVMDGRDIGTVVFPDAELKIFMTADPKIRALRRFHETGGNIPLEKIEENIRERDYQDGNRELSPLRKAEDAIVLDNSNMTIEKQMEWVRGPIANLVCNL